MTGTSIQYGAGSRYQKGNTDTACRNCADWFTRHKAMISCRNIAAILIRKI